VLAACTPQDPTGSITAAELSSRIATGDAPLVVDVRGADEYAAGHIPGAVNIPHDQIAARVGELGADTNLEIVVHCASGRRADIATQYLVGAGYSRVRPLAGHYGQWSAEGFPVE
jgi:phage shock protein E